MIDLGWRRVKVDDLSLKWAFGCQAKVYERERDFGSVSDFSLSYDNAFTIDICFRLMLFSGQPTVKRFLSRLLSIINIFSDGMPLEQSN